MIELEVTKTTCEHGASIFTAAPSEICLGGMDASGVDILHVTVPDDWKNCVVRATFIPSMKKAVAKLLDDNGNVLITSDVTGRAAKGVLVIDAVRDDYAAYSNDILWTTYAHSQTGGKVSSNFKSEYEQIAELVEEVRLTEDDVLDILAETDTLPSVADASGAILTDENGKILMM